MADPFVVDQNEVVLGSTTFRINGPVRPRLVSPFPAKIVIGDQSRSDDTLAAQWAISDFRGGLGIEDLDESSHLDRFWWAVANTLEAKRVTLPPLAVDAGNGGLTGSVIIHLLPEYNSNFYGVFESGGVIKLYRWTDGTDPITDVGSWADLGHTLTKTPTDWTVFKEKLYLIASDRYAVFDGTTFAEKTPASWSGAYGDVWDDKLVVIGRDTKLRASADPDATTPTWTTNATVPVSTAELSNLYIGRNADDDPTIYVPTTRGLYAIDYANAKAYPTDMRYSHPYGGRSSFPYSDGAVYIPEGLEVYKLSGRSVVRSGIERDDGLPADIVGSVTLLNGTRDLLLAIVDATAQRSFANTEYYAGDLFSSDVIGAPIDAGNSALFAHNGIGWHCLYKAPNSGKAITALTVSHLFSETRVWIGLEGRTYYFRFPSGPKSFSRDTRSLYATSGQLYTGRFDANFTEIDKVALTLTLEAQQITATEQIDVYYALNRTSAWTFLGTVSANGRTTLKFSDSGITFSAIQLRFDMRRGSTATLTPLLTFASLRYYLAADALFGWGFELDATEDYGGKTADELVAAVKIAAETKTRLRFIFRDNSGTKTYWVRIFGLIGLEMTGIDQRGAYQVQVVQLAA